MAARNPLVDLRNLLAERFPAALTPRPTHLSTGLAFLDAAIAGGLCKGAITEIISPQLSAGSATLIAALLQAAQRDRYFVALIDGSDSFDPQPLGNNCLRHLLWMRCDTARTAMQAADLLLRDGNFPLVIVDLVLNPAEQLRKIPQANWYRLQRLVEPTSSACLVLSRQSMVASAQLKLVLENAWTLSSFEADDALARLRVRIQRSHARSTWTEAAS
ncbi:MAG: hypothetical protein ABJB69_00235 [Spartobacteria bacterium]